MLLDYKLHEMVVHFEGAPLPNCQQTCEEAAATLGALSRCFLLKQEACNVVVCVRYFCSHTTVLQRFVPWARILKNYSIQNNRINKMLT